MSEDRKWIWTWVGAIEDGMLEQGFPLTRIDKVNALLEQGFPLTREFIDEWTFERYVAWTARSPRFKAVKVDYHPESGELEAWAEDDVYLWHRQVFKLDDPECFGKLAAFLRGNSEEPTYRLVEVRGRHGHDCDPRTAEGQGRAERA